MSRSTAGSGTRAGPPPGSWGGNGRKEAEDVRRLVQETRLPNQRTPEDAAEGPAAGRQTQGAWRALGTEGRRGQPSVRGSPSSCDTRGLHSQACCPAGNPAKDKALSLRGRCSRDAGNRKCVPCPGCPGTARLRDRGRAGGQGTAGVPAGPQSGHVERQPPGLRVWTAGRGLGGGESVGLGGDRHSANVASRSFRRTGKASGCEGATGTEEGEAGRGGPEIGCAGERSLWKKCDRCCVMVVARQRGQSSRGGGGSGFRGAGDARGDPEGRAAGRSRRLGPGEGAEPPPRQRGPPEGRRGGPPPLVHASIPTFYLFRERSTLKTRKSRSFRPLAGRGAGGTHLPRMKAM